MAWRSMSSHGVRVSRASQLAGRVVSIGTCRGEVWTWLGEQGIRREDWDASDDMSSTDRKKIASTPAPYMLLPIHSFENGPDRLRRTTGGRDIVGNMKTYTLPRRKNHYG